MTVGAPWGHRRGYLAYISSRFPSLAEKFGRWPSTPLMHPLSVRLVPMNPVFCQDCQSGKVKILETRHLAHGRVQAARRRRSTGTAFVSR